jgi:hypothetical protein
MNSSHIEFIVEWLPFKSIHDIQVFLSFANYYWHFIKGYSHIILSIMRLLKKNQKFFWDKRAERSFDILKTAFTSALILYHFDSVLPIMFHTDSSEFVLFRILSQTHESCLHSVVFWFQKCISTECNYDIHDHKLFTIMKLIKH